MAHRKLLILTYHFPPSAAAGAFRMLGFAEHLPEFGWQTVVVAPPGLPWEAVDETLLERVPAETVVYRVPYPDSWVWEAAAEVLPCGVPGCCSPRSAATRRFANIVPMSS